MNNQYISLFAIVLIIFVSGCAGLEQLQYGIFQAVSPTTVEEAADLVTIQNLRIIPSTSISAESEFTFSFQVKNQDESAEIENVDICVYDTGMCTVVNAPQCERELEEGEVAECGNGIKETGEDCDDGNTEDGDGCSSACKIEKQDCPKTKECCPADDPAYIEKACTSTTYNKCEQYHCIRLEGCAPSGKTRCKGDILETCVGTKGWRAQDCTENNWKCYYDETRNAAYCAE